MKTNLPINIASSNGSSTAYSSFDRPGNQEKPDIATSSLQSIKEMKQAENRGVKVSVAEEQLIKAIEKANKALEGVATSCKFSIHESTKQIMVKVVETETGKVIREVPPEKILDLVASMCEKAGIWIDERR